MNSLSKFRHVFVVLMVLLFSIQPLGYVYPAESQQSESLIKTMAWVLAKGATEGADAFLKSNFRNTWGAVKAAFTPAAQVLMSRYPGFKEWWENPPGRVPSKRAQKAAKRASFNVLSDPELQQLIIKEFDKLERGQKEIQTAISTLSIDFRNFADTQEESLEEMKTMLRLALDLIQRQEKNSRSSQIDEYWLSGTWGLHNCNSPSSTFMYVVDSPRKIQELRWGNSDLVSAGGEFTGSKRFIHRRTSDFFYDSAGNNIILTHYSSGPTGAWGHVRQRIKVVDHKTLMWSGTCYVPSFGRNVNDELVHGFCKDGWDTGVQIGRGLIFNRCEAGTRLY